MRVIGGQTDQSTKLPAGLVRFKGSSSPLSLFKRLCRLAMQCLCLGEGLLRQRCAKSMALQEALHFHCNARSPTNAKNPICCACSHAIVGGGLRSCGVVWCGVDENRPDEDRRRERDAMPFFSSPLLSDCLGLEDEQGSKRVTV